MITRVQVPLKEAKSSSKAARMSADLLLELFECGRTLRDPFLSSVLYLLLRQDVVVKQELT